MSRQARRDGLVLDDLSRISWLSDCASAPSGGQVAAVETRLDAARDRIVRRVLVASEGAAVRWIDSPGSSDTAPRWSPNGTQLAYLSDRDGASRVWIANAAGGAPRMAADLVGCWGEPAWSPDGGRIAVAAITPAAGPDTSSCTEVAEVPFKVDGIGGASGLSRSSIRIIAPGEREPQRFEIPGVVVCGAPVWAPDGRTLAVLARSIEDGMVTDRTVAWALDLASGAVRRVAGGAGSVLAIAWSPDSSAIAYVGHHRGDAEAVDRQVWLAPARGGEPRCLTATLGRSVGTIVRSDDPRGESEARLAWSGRLDRIYFQFADGGSGQLAWVDPSGAWQVVVTGERACLSFSLDAPGTTIAFVSSSPSTPGELHRCDADGGNERRVTFLNDALLDERSLLPMEPFRAMADDGQELEGWITTPTADPGAPLVLDVHGGPHYSVGWRFSFERQRLGNRGLGVLTANPRGSQGYGQDFASAVIGDWGGRDYLDLMTVLDGALDGGWGDRHRLAIRGVSYGGFMTQWALTRTDRFRAAISVNGISNLLALWGHGVDPGRFVTAELGGTPWERAPLYSDRSPITSADRIVTPLLLLHGELDQDSPIAQSEQLFVALRRLGRDVAFVRVAGEGHLMMIQGRPSVRRSLAERLEVWLRERLVVGVAE